ncbi:MAG TPA: M1 family metallopeptidase, partial [Acidimicrobiales bacterium]
GSPAAHRVEREELVVDPDPILVADEIFVVEVSYHGSPAPRPHPILGSIGWQRAGDVTIVVSEPYGAHYWFPSNDHPSDKAAFSFRITVPEGTTAVASGVLVSTSTADGRTTWEWHHPDPMPTYVAAVAIGPLELVESTGPHGVVIRHAFAQSLAAGATVAFEQTAGMIADLEAIFGPYPFDAYGALVVDASLGFALENQTLSLFDRSIVDGSLAASLTMVHELAHHWFGNWVSPATWQDIWLNEGFATYAEALWLEHTVPGYDIDAAMRELAAGPPLGPIGDPGSADLFTLPVYRRGALTLHALRRTMGDAGFFQLLRAWADRYGGESAGTEDFVALATEVAGSDMRPLLEAWLHAPEMPPLP